MPTAESVHREKGRIDPKRVVLLVVGSVLTGIGFWLTVGSEALGSWAELSLLLLIAGLTLFGLSLVPRE